MVWQVRVKKRMAKELAELPQPVQKAFALLAREMELLGPVRGNWPNYSKLGENRHHCHLKRGRTTYVAVWEVAETGEIQLIEVTYVGTHERAPY